MSLPLDEDDLEGLDFDEAELMAPTVPWGMHTGVELPPVDRFSGTTQGTDGGRREQQSPLAGVFP